MYCLQKKLKRYTTDYYFYYIAKKLRLSINIKKKKSCSHHDLKEKLSRPVSNIVSKALGSADKFCYYGHLCLKTLWQMRKSHRLNTNEAFEEIKTSYPKEDPTQSKTESVLYSSDFHFFCTAKKLELLVATLSISINSKCIFFMHLLASNDRVIS